MSKPQMKLDRENNPGRARWCEEHQRLECTGNRNRGRGICHEPAIRGTDKGRVHSGIKAKVAKVRGQSTITAWSAIGQPADGKALDAGMAVLGMLQMTWLRASAYGELLRRQVQDEQARERLMQGQGFIPGDEPNDEVGGLVGYRYGAAGKDGNIYAVGEEARALVALESAERDRVVKFAKTAHDMGISTRLTNLAERWGDVVVTRIMMMLDELDLTEEQELKVPLLIQSHLGQIDVSMGGNES